MNPYKLKNVFEYLTSNNQLLKKKLKLGTSEIPIPNKREDVTTIEAINRFNKANPRVDTTSLKPLSVKQSNIKQSNVSEPNEGVIQGAFDTATREAQSEGFPAPNYDKFKSRYLKKNMKADGGRIGLKDGEGVITVDDKIDEMISFYKDYLNQGGKMDFQTFSKKYIPENFAEGGRAGYEDGGMLVQPSDDGSRPGYAKSKGKGIQLTAKEQKLLKDNLSTEDFNKLDFDRTGLQSGQKNYGVGRNDDSVLLRKVRNILNPGQDSVGIKILNNKNWTDTVIKLTNQGKSPLDITNVLSKKDSKITRNVVSSAINALIDRKQLNKKYYVMPSSGLIKGDFDKKLKIVEKLVNKGDLGRADIGREAGVSDSVVEKWIRTNKGDEFYETNFTYEKGVLKKGTLQKQKDLFNLVESKGSISAAEISKLFKIDNAQSKTLMADLVSTIYRMSGDSKSNSLVVPYDDSERMKSVLNTIRTAPDFEDIYQRRIETLVREAFPKGSKAQKQAIQSLKDYRKFSFQLKEMAPELALALDHIVPYQFLDEVAQGANPINLIRVKPITGAVNRFKSNFDKVRIDLNRALKIDPNNKQLLQKFKLLKELEELTPIEFGGVSKNGTVYNFKQKPIGQSDLIADAKLAIQNYDDVGTFSQQVLGDPNLQAKFIQSGISSKDLGMFKNIKPINSKKKANILSAFCNRKGFKLAGSVEGLTCSMEEIQTNMQKQIDEAAKVSKDGKIPKKFGKLKAFAGSFFGDVAIPLEYMFAAPYLAAGDIEGAKRATTAGLLGYGKVDLDKLPEGEGQRFLKHINALNSFMDNYQTKVMAENDLEKSMASGTTEGRFMITDRIAQAAKNMKDISLDYQTYGYDGQKGLLQGKVAAQQLIRDQVQSDYDKKIKKATSTQFFKDSDKELLESNIRYGDKENDPNQVTPITDLESYIRNKGEATAGNTNLFFNVKPYTLNRAEALGVPDIFDQYAGGYAGVESPGFIRDTGEVDMGTKSVMDAYSSLPTKYASQLAALEKKQFEEGMLKKDIEQRLTGSDPLQLASGGIASLTKTIPPESGPTPQGLPYVYNSVKKI